MTKVRAKAFFRTGPQVDDERKAQLEILKIKIAKRNHGLDPKTLELVIALLQPQSYYQALKADAARKVAVVKKFGPGDRHQLADVELSRPPRPATSTRRRPRSPPSGRRRACRRGAARGRRDR